MQTFALNARAAMRAATRAGGALRAVFDEGHYRRVAGIGPRIDALSHYRAEGDRAGLSPVALFDPAHYLARVPEAAEREGTLLEDYLARAGTDPVDPHPMLDARWYGGTRDLGGRPALVDYLTEGWRAGAAPHPLFWPAWYAPRAMGALAGTMDPATHFLCGGWREAGPNPLFDRPAGAGGRDPFGRWLARGAEAGEAPHPLLDPAWLAPQVGADGVAGVLAFLASDGASPHPLFDPAHYAARRGDLPPPPEAPVPVGRAATALIAYLEAGAAGAADPHPLFDRAHYRAHAPDVAAAGMDPLLHHVGWGAAERRAVHPLVDMAHLAAQTDAPDPLAALAAGGAEGRLSPRPPAAPDRRPVPLPAIRAVTDLPLERDAPARPATVGAFVHVFHPDLLEELLGHLAHVPPPCRLFVSTDTAAKAALIEARLRRGVPHPWEVRVLPNRGRDLGPMLVGYADRLREVEVVLHVHTKRSLHHPGGLDLWRRHLLRGVLASPGYVAGVLDLLARPGVGAVVPDHHPSTRPLLQWGGNRAAAAALLGMMGESLVGTDGAEALDFPAGSMFWARSAALAPLLDLALPLEGFEPEAGQTDGTLAHAIERILLRVVEAAGFAWHAARPVAESAAGACADDGGPAPGNRFWPAARDRGVAADHVPELAGFLARPSSEARPRVTLLIPTVDRAQGWAGIATALDLFGALRAALGPEVDARWLATDAAPGPGYDPPEGASLAGPWAPDGPGDTVEAAHDRGARPVLVRRDEAFVATAWWTAHHAAALGRARADLHGGAVRPHPYLIQDWEPGFDAAGTRSELARATYHAPGVLPVFNAPPLAEAFRARGLWPCGAGHVLAPPIPAEVAGAIVPGTPKERIVLLYARAHAARNCLPFLDMLVAHLRRTDPGGWRGWRFVAAGEDLPEGALRCGGGIETAGRLPLGAYGALASRAALGVSLMIAPHPSYPPLEMAQAGVRVLTSAVEGRHPERLHPNLVGLPVLDLEAAAAAMTRMRAAWEADPAGGWAGRARADWFFDGRGNLGEVAAALAADLRPHLGLPA
ncbi:hypothetical protein JQC91_04030 [Jannaschia sp. Os4]|uniref:rhamnosyltransferase WsaF family glycosyltransferase n=1 Tax=Jannaschia sp. Os4 TaxID=2807617 RepID=UPI00193A94E7|nr:rhamnan synthesis F family protein [Jannaschia sp. Os4]MBM2575463.1 hypothetical protein [Jannaschia sp. Os4]